MRHAGSAVEAAPARLAFALGSRLVEVANVRREWRTYMIIENTWNQSTSTGRRDGGRRRRTPPLPLSGDRPTEGNPTATLHLKDAYLHLKDVLDHIESAAWGSAGAGETYPAARRGPA